MCIFTYFTGQQNLTFFLAHEEKYLILIEILKLNSKCKLFSITHSLFVTAKLTLCRPYCSKQSAKDLNVPCWPKRSKFNAPWINFCLIISFTSCVWPHTTKDMITVNCMWPPSVQNHLKYLFMYKKNHWWKYQKIPKNQQFKRPLYKNCGWWKNFNCIFGFSVKSYVRNKINLSCAKILLTSVIRALEKIPVLLHRTPWHCFKLSVCKTTSRQLLQGCRKWAV